MADEDIRPGFFQDKYGNWHRDRRVNGDRRRRNSPYGHSDRRTQYRRKTDRAIMEREAREQIEEALVEFGVDQATD